MPIHMAGERSYIRSGGGRVGTIEDLSHPHTKKTAVVKNFSHFSRMFIHNLASLACLKFFFEVQNTKNIPKSTAVGALGDSSLVPSGRSPKSPRVRNRFRASDRAMVANGYGGTECDQIQTSAHSD